MLIRAACTARRQLFLHAGSPGSQLHTRSQKGCTGVCSEASVISVISMRNFVSAIVWGMVVSAFSMAAAAQTGSGREQTIGALEHQVQKDLHEQKPELAVPVLRQIISLILKKQQCESWCTAVFSE